MRVMLVDDDPFMLNLLARQLESLGVTAVTETESPVAALSVLMDDPVPFDAVFLDLNMPGMDGIQFIRELAWQEYPGALILLSGTDERILASAERLARGEGLMVAGRLRKPVATEALAALLDQVRAPATGASRPRRATGRGFSAGEVAAAIEAGQLVNHYQPQVSFADGALVGLEALVRWEHPEEGLVLPYRFVAAAEAGGVIGALTNCVLRKAMADLRRWRKLGVGLRVSVNVTMADLMDLEGPDRLAACAAEYGIGLERLALEITESQLAADWSRALDVASRLRLKGVDLAIDDYGTGYSSLKQLRDLPFNELKLDRSFIHGAAGAEALTSIVAPHIDMAHRLGLKVVAEGIEDESDWRYLRRLDCDIGQGYFIGRPMAAGEIGAWCQNWLRRCAEGGLVNHD